ncbi:MULTISPECIES: NAD-dependent epimerase/dehydratase family protein [unclassified Paenibacillus]|uniref:NAD-dependent epimerase/dehydratase family protein n=1 Tax=unclassified Paenibacillus TaxID=185978 RepID=UPI000402698A|nr:MULTISPECIES: NAD(P)-dependent oxidoreductase [unclassified Paenibacillus]KGP80869.1 NAD-dependent dehydratase [Paenibacillus sp. MAEPY2]KGP88030.1 NAD-dependent dehydratase [Paenibacillus sp. MAEPY1]
MKKKIIVTGANGFIGSHVVDELALAGEDVYAISSKVEHKINTSNVTWLKADLLDDNQIENIFSIVGSPTHLLHLAWDTTPNQYWNSSSNFKWVSASLSLFDRFRVAGGKRIVGVGSCAEYDLSQGLCKESETPLSYNTVYGSSKNSLHHMLMTYSQHYEISSAWARLFYLYGPREHQLRLVPSVILSLLNDKKAKCSHGQQIRDYMYVKDAAQALVKLLSSESNGPVNIGSGKSISLSEIIYKIADILQHRELIQLGAIPTSVEEPKIVLADITKLIENTGWTPSTKMEDGLYETVQWWKSSLSGGK